MLEIRSAALALTVGKDARLEGEFTFADTARATDAAGTLEDFNAALPALRDAGYALNAVDIQLGLPPRLVAKFNAAHEASDEKVQALLAEHAERRLTVLLLKALAQASRFQNSVKIVGMTPVGLEVEIGLTQHVTIKFG